MIAREYIDHSAPIGGRDLVSQLRRDMMPNTPTIYIVDDNEDQLELAYEMLIEADYEAKTFLSGGEFLQQSEINELGCLLLDNQMPEISGLDVQAELNRRNIDLPIVFMSGASMYSHVVDAVQQGALNFLQKPFSMAELLESIALAVGESHKRQEAKIDRSEQTRLLASLTPREKQIYEMVVKGHTNKNMSETLSIAIGTVEFHRANIMQKLKVTKLVDLMAISTMTES